MYTQDQSAAIKRRKRITTLIVSLTAALCLLLGVLIGQQDGLWNKGKIVHIQSAQVFAEFQLKLELESKLSNLEQSRTRVLKELELEIKAMESRAGAADTLQFLVDQYVAKEAEFAKDQSEQSEQFTEQIWTQLNQYLQDYCDAEGISYLLGADGSGHLMGADENKDVTEEVIAFVNQQYQNG